MTKISTKHEGVYTSGADFREQFAANHNNNLSRRDILKGLSMCPVAPLVSMPQESEAWLGWVFRFLLRGVVRRGAVRKGNRATRRVAPRGRLYAVGGGASASRYSYGRTANHVWDGYTALDFIRSLSGLSSNVYALPDQVVEYIQEHDIGTVWFKGVANSVSFSFLNDSTEIIPSPEIYFEEANLETDVTFTRERHLSFLDDWAPGAKGDVPIASTSKSQLPSLAINQTGPVSIRPYCPDQPNVIFDEFTVVVVDPNDVQFR
ncbi:MAG: hypothetical protein AAF542_19340 [Pseudomonadota bacterium]